MTEVILNDNDQFEFDNLSTLICSKDQSNYSACWLEEELRANIYPRPYEWIFVTLHALVFFVGLTGNALICLFVYRNRHLRNVTNYFIVNLAVADFLVILICLPPTVLWDITNTWFFGDLMCKLVVYFQYVSVSVSVLTLTFISVDRWYAICRPLKFKSTITKTRLAIIFIWISSLAINLPDLLHLKTKSPFLRNETIYYTDCVHDWPDKMEKIYQLWIVTTYFLLPIFLMSVAYHQIAIVLWNKNIPGYSETGHHAIPASTPTKTIDTVAGSKRADGSTRNKTKPSYKRSTTVEDSQIGVASTANGGQKSTTTTPKNTKKYPYDSQVTSRQRVAKMLIAVVIMFGLCYLPVHALNTLRCFISLPQNDIISILSLISHWLCYANSAINPIIYNFMSAKFRKEFHTTFQNLCGLWACRERRRHQESISGTRRQSNPTQFENINLNSVARHNGQG